MQTRSVLAHLVAYQKDPKRRDYSQPHTPLFAKHAALCTKNVQLHHFIVRKIRSVLPRNLILNPSITIISERWVMPRTVHMPHHVPTNLILQRHEIALHPLIKRRMHLFEPLRRSKELLLELYDGFPDHVLSGTGIYAVPLHVQPHRVCHLRGAAILHRGQFDVEREVVVCQAEGGETEVLDGSEEGVFVCGEEKGHAPEHQGFGDTGSIVSVVCRENRVQGVHTGLRRRGCGSLDIPVVC